MNVFEKMIFPRDEIVPAKPPPPGVKSNFINPQSRQPEMIAINAILLTIATLFLLMRLWTRSFITRSIGWDDYTCVVAMILNIGHSIGSLEILKYGVGIHMWDVPRTVYKRPGFLIWNLVTYTTFIPSMGLIKLSILLLYLRLFSSGFKTRTIIYGLLFFVGSYTLAFELSALFGCQPVPRLFNRSLKGKCITFHYHILIQQVFNIISDILLFIVPIPVAWRLNLPFKQRLGVMFVFMTASMSCVAGFIRMSTITSEKKGDVTWEQFDGTMWSVIELNLALICSCMPAFKPFLQHTMPFLRTHFSKIYTSTTSSSSSSNNNKNTTTTTTSSSSSSSTQQNQCKAEFVELQDRHHHHNHQKGVVYAVGGGDNDVDVEKAAAAGAGVSVVREVEISIDEDERTIHSQV